MSQLPSGLKTLSDVGSVQSITPLPGFIRISVCLPAETVRPSLRSAAASRWRSSPESRDNNTGARVRFHRETDSETRAGSARDVGARCSEVWFPGRAAPDVRWICRERCCCNLTAPPLCQRADQSQPCSGARPRSHWTAGLSVTEASVSNLNTEIT